MKAKAKDLRIRSKEILSAVERGEEVIITYRGTPKARIIPYEIENRRKQGSKSTHNSLFGIWSDHDGVSDVDEFIRTIREKR